MRVYTRTHTHTYTYILTYIGIKLAHLPLVCFQNLFNFISSAAWVASSSSYTSFCYPLAFTFKVDSKKGRRERKREGENERETLMKGITKWTASSSGGCGLFRQAPRRFSLLPASCLSPSPCPLWPRDDSSWAKMRLAADCLTAVECESAWNPSWIFFFFFF